MWGENHPDELSVKVKMIRVGNSALGEAQPGRGSIWYLETLKAMAPPEMASELVDGKSPGARPY